MRQTVTLTLLLAFAATANAASVLLKRDGGTFVVPVLINDKITLEFTLDSGAADVSIPADVFSTLVRAGTVSKGDFIDTQAYRLADGSAQRSQRFRIKSLKVGNVELRNVIGSVAPPAGSLLLGQSFLSRLQSWSIDNHRQLLVINEEPHSGTTADTSNAVESNPAPQQPSTSQNAASGFIAEYSGHYACGQGATGLTVRIVKSASGSSANAIFSFGPVAGNPYVPSGSYRMQGEIDLIAGVMNFIPVAWIEQPGGYSMIGLKGTSLDGGQSFSGSLVGGYMCSGFWLTRSK